MRFISILLLLIAYQIDAQIYETDVAIGLISGEEVYGRAKIPNTPNRAIQLIESDDLPRKIITASEIEYILVDLLVTKKQRVEGELVHEEKRFYITPLNLGDEEKSKWIYAVELIKGDLSYYGYMMKATEPNYSTYYNNFDSDFPTTTSSINNKYTFSCKRFLYMDMFGSIHKSSNRKATYLQKNAEILMPDCLNLVKEIRAQKRFIHGDIESYILRYNQGCY